MDILFNSIGVTGMLLLLAAYFLLQRGTFTGNDPRYLWMNLLSAIALIISLFRFWNMPSFLLDIAWIFISIQGLIRVRRKKA